MLCNTCERSERRIGAFYGRCTGNQSDLQRVCAVDCALPHAVSALVRRGARRGMEWSFRTRPLRNEPAADRAFVRVLGPARSRTMLSELP